MPRVRQKPPTKQPPAVPKAAQALPPMLPLDDETLTTGDAGDDSSVDPAGPSGGCSCSMAIRLPAINSWGRWG